MTTINNPATESPTLTIMANDGTELLAIHSDGTVTGAIENAGPAARQFVVELRGLTETIAAQAKAEALREVAEWEAEADTSIRCADNLRQSTRRADWKEAGKYEHHATISRNLAARMRETLAATIEGKGS